MVGSLDSWRFVIFAKCFGKPAKQDRDLPQESILVALPISAWRQSKRGFEGARKVAHIDKSGFQGDGGEVFPAAAQRLGASVQTPLANMLGDAAPVAGKQAVEPA